jgi:hypothetical protein
MSAPCGLDLKARSAPTGQKCCCGWLRRAGLAGSLFFLIKGLLWILVPAALAWFGG